MPARRGGRGGKKRTPQKNNQDIAAEPVKAEPETPQVEVTPVSENPPEQENANAKSDAVEVKEEPKSENTEENKQAEVKKEEEEDTLPFKVKVSHLPANYVVNEFQDYLETTFNIPIPKIISPAKNSPWLLIPFATKPEQENFVRLLHNHVWKKKALRAIAFESLKRKAEDGEEDPDIKKLKEEEEPVMTLEEEILSESLPLHSVSYEEQNRLTVQDVELLSNKLHAFMCVRNPDLAGWAEAMCNKNNGYIYSIEPLKPSPFLEGYRNKCKFRIGKNADGEITVGFCLNDNENKILGVQPGDKLIHLPDSMKYAAKKFEEYIRTTGKDPYDKRKKSGYWDHVIIRIAPEGDLMLVVVMYHNNLKEDELKGIKEGLKEFFVNGAGKECNLFSLYFQLMNDKPPILPPEKLELLVGEPSFEEIICGLKFYVGPFSILNVNSPAAENIYNSIIELAQPTKETIVLDLCAGTGGIAFTIADHCEKVIAIESQEDNVNDALKTMKLNEITNVEFIKAKVEDELSKVFENNKGKTIIPVIDPPRQGLVQKAISQLRCNEGISKLIYVCSNSKMGVKNFLDLCASAEKKEGTFGNPLNVEFAGLPFLPVKAVPVDVAPYTVNNTIVILFERIDPSTFPPATKPPPVPIKKPQSKRDDRRNKGKKQGRRFSSRGVRGGQRVRERFGRSQPVRNRYGPGERRRNRGPPGPNGPGPGGRNNRFPPPLMGPMGEPAMSLISKYERRIAELEQQDRAFKAGLSMGLQALGQRGAAAAASGGNLANLSQNLRSLTDFPAGQGFNNNAFGGGNNSPWQNNAGRNFGGNNGNFGNLGNLNNLGNFGNLGNLGNVSNVSNVPSLANLGNLGNAGNGFGNNFGNNFGGGGGGGGNGRNRRFGGGGGGGGGGGNKRFRGNKGQGGGGGGGGGNKSGGGFRNYQGNKPRR